ncbi:hypothetical protein N2152v2_003624 [Parachlorella kessleri]
MNSKSEEPKSRKQEVEQLKGELAKGGITKEVAKQVLDAWEGDSGHSLTPEDLRKVIVKSSTRFTGYVLVQVLLDAGAAYGAFLVGNMIGKAMGHKARIDASVPQYGLPATILSALSYILAGYYATGVAFDFFKLGALLVGVYQFNVNSSTFLEAVQELAKADGGSTGLSTFDKAREAVNTYKVLQALLRMSDLLKDQQAAGSSSSGPDMLRDLGAYLTLDRAQRSYGFDAAKAGLTDAKAMEIAVVFSKYDRNDDGVISLDEFKRLCADFAPELSEAEVQTGFKVLDVNQDNQIQFNEFVNWWMKKLQLPQQPEEGSTGTQTA